MTNAVEKLIDQAWDARTPSKRAIFARRALALDRTAVDAYVALALTSRHPPSASPSCGKGFATAKPFGSRS